MPLAPIVLFVYNRPWHTQQTVEALQKCELATESDLYIFADGPKEDASEEVKNRIKEVRQYIHAIDGFKNIYITESSINKGLANSVIQGVTEIINKHGKVIVVEDDILTHPFCMQYFNHALNFYEEDTRIFCLGAYTDKIEIPLDYPFDIFVCKRVETWGWATWKDRWENANWDIDNYKIFHHPTRKQIKNLCRGGDDLWTMLKDQKDGKIDSWAIRWQYNMTLADGLCLRPINTFAQTIGLDGSGTHCGNVLDNNTLLSPRKGRVSIWESAGLPSTPIFNHATYDIRLVSGIEENGSIISAIQQHFKQPKDSAWKRVKRLIKHSLRHATSFCHHTNL